MWHSAVSCKEKRNNIVYEIQPKKNKNQEVSFNRIHIRSPSLSHYYDLLTPQTSLCLSLSLNPYLCLIDNVPHSLTIDIPNLQAPISLFDADLNDKLINPLFFSILCIWACTCLLKYVNMLSNWWKYVELKLLGWPNCDAFLNILAKIKSWPHCVIETLAEIWGSIISSFFFPTNFELWNCLNCERTSFWGWKKFQLIEFKILPKKK